MGFTAYWGHLTNRFDLIVTLVPSMLQIAALIFPSFMTVRVLRIILLARTFRLLRLLSNTKRFVYISSTFVHLLPTFSNLFGLLFFVNFMYSLIGMQAFGGVIVVRKNFFKKKKEKQKKKKKMKERCCIPLLENSLF